MRKTAPIKLVDGPKPVASITRSMDDMPTLYTSRIIINTAGASAYHSAEASGSARSAGGNLVCFS